MEESRHEMEIAITINNQNQSITNPVQMSTARKRPPPLTREGICAMIARIPFLEKLARGEIAWCKDRTYTALTASHESQFRVDITTGIEEEELMMRERDSFSYSRKLRKERRSAIPLAARTPNDINIESNTQHHGSTNHSEFEIGIIYILDDQQYGPWMYPADTELADVMEDITDRHDLVTDEYVWFNGESWTTGLKGRKGWESMDKRCTLKDMEDNYKRNGKMASDRIVNEITITLHRKDDQSRSMSSFESNSQYQSIAVTVTQPTNHSDSEIGILYFLDDQQYGPRKYPADAELADVMGDIAERHDLAIEDIEQDAWFYGKQMDKRCTLKDMEDIYKRNGTLPSDYGVKEFAITFHKEDDQSRSMSRRGTQSRPSMRN